MDIDKIEERAQIRNTVENMEGIENYRKWFQHQKAYTRNKNARKLKTYCEFVGKTPEQLLGEYKEAEDKKVWQRDTRNSILKFYNWLKEQGYAINTEHHQGNGDRFLPDSIQTDYDLEKAFYTGEISSHEYKR